MPILNTVFWGGGGSSPNYKTITIKWTEQSDMSTGFTYLDDATGQLAGSTFFDEFFWYSAVRLASDGTETAEVKQTVPGVLDITQLGDLTTGNNVMIKFPVRGIKMSKSWSIVTLSITKELGKSWYQYFAFNKTGNVNDNNENTATYPFYLGAYMWYNASNTLKSLSDKTPTGNITPTNLLTYAKNNGTGWTLAWLYQRWLLYAYYIMKYWNPNWEAIIGKGNINASSVINTGGTNVYTNATYGETTGYYQMKLFWVEDWTGNLAEFILWCFTDASRNLYVALHSFNTNKSTSDTNYKNVWTWATTGGSSCISSIFWNNKAMFLPNAFVNNNNYNTYYCQCSYNSASSYLLAEIKSYWLNSNFGFTYIASSVNPASSYTKYWGRLMYM